MDGVVNVRKPQGPTSHDVVDAVRRIFGQKRVGHAGTLDPMATGVLVVCLGKATRVVEYLMGGVKEYRARMVLGISTDSQDSTGVVTSESDASGVTREALEQAILAFVGEIEQIPPMVSAIKHQGKALYKLAREGKTIDRAARQVTIDSIDLIDFTPGVRAEAEIVVKCSSGTYIRTLCSDIGDSLGCGANMSALERTRVGRFVLDGAVSVEELEQAKMDGRLEDCVISTETALDFLPLAVLPDEDETNIMHGSAVVVECDAGRGETVRMSTESGWFLGLGVIEVVDDARIVQPKKVLVDMMPEGSC